MGFPGGSVVKNLPANVGDVSLVPGLGRHPGEGNPFQLLPGKFLGRLESMGLQKSQT